MKMQLSIIKNKVAEYIWTSKQMQGKFKFIPMIISAYNYEFFVSMILLITLNIMLKNVYIEKVSLVLENEKVYFNQIFYTINGENTL